MKPTDPFDLPAVPPSIPDWQHSSVERAEREVRGNRPPTAVELSRLIEELDLPLTKVRGAKAAYWRTPTPELQYGEEAPLELVLHHAAHHATDAAFPTHGAEWAQTLIGLVRTYLGDGRAAAYRTAFDRHGVHYSPEHRVIRVHKATTFAPNKEPGCLARIVLADPPRELLCQMLRRDGGTLLVRDRTGEYELQLEEIRYVSYALKERRP